MRMTTKLFGIAMAGLMAMTSTSVLANEVVRNTQENQELRGDWVIGATVRAPDESVVGTITDLLIDEQQGTVTAAVIDVGGFLGFGAKSIAVDWNQLQLSYDANEVTLPITRDEADEAPEFAFRERDFAPAPAPATGGDSLAPPPAGGGVPN